MRSTLPLNSSFVFKLGFISRIYRDSSILRNTAYLAVFPNCRHSLGDALLHHNSVLFLHSSIWWKMFLDSNTTISAGHTNIAGIISWKLNSTYKVT